VKARCIWFTGLPCSGKTTIAEQLLKYFPVSQLLDGDLIRKTDLGLGLDFTLESRKTHILRMGEISKLLVDSGVTTICSFVSPSNEVRDLVRAKFEEGQFIEVYVNTPLDECIKRDVKGMYKKALNGEIDNFTGISSPYEAPVSPEFTVNTQYGTVGENVGFLADCLIREYKPSAFIGRWNGCLHLGHEMIINQELDKGKPVLLLIKDVKPDKSNPWTSREVQEMLDYRYRNNPSVETVIIPDINSVNYGRTVGYDVREIKVDSTIASISGTKCRELIKAGNNEWKNLVSEDIAIFLDNKYGE